MYLSRNQYRIPSGHVPWQRSGISADWWHIFDTDIRKVVCGTKEQSCCADDLEYVESVNDHEFEVLVKSEYSKIPCIWCNMPGNYEDSGEWPGFIICLECDKQIFEPFFWEALIKLYKEKDNG